jgi:ferredoxin-thioredoxin reductase catalytic subunit
LGILIFKGLSARRVYKSFGVKGLIHAGSRNNRITEAVVRARAIVCACVHLSSSLNVICVCYSQLYRSASFNSSGRSSTCDTADDMYSDVSLEEDMIDLNHKVS